MWIQLLNIITIVYFLSSCSRLPVSPIDAVRVSSENSWADQESLSSFKTSLSNTIKSLERSKKETIKLGRNSLTKKDYLNSLYFLQSCVKTKKTLKDIIRKEFTPYTVYGKDNWGEILMTSYYEPVLRGSIKKTKKHQTPIYAAPKNLVEVRLNQFEIEDYGLKGISKPRVSAQVVKGDNGQNQVVPLPSRADIDFRGALSGSNLEIAYADLIDVFFLHIQGSGVLTLPNGREVRLGYAAQNGRKYEPIGKFMKDKIDPEEMSMQAIEDVLRREGVNYTKKILSKNPSYVFFQKLKGRSLTTIGAEVTDKRTIAVDQRYFPLGILGHVSYPDPQTPPEKMKNKVEKYENAHFVFAQDTGGAIKGPGRADLFWGP